MKAEPHSQQASRGKISSPSNLPSAADPKNRTQGNWNEEIINTSKEIHGESSHKSRAEMQSNRSSGEVQREESNPNFRSPQWDSKERWCVEGKIHYVANSYHNDELN